MVNENLISRINFKNATKNEYKYKYETDLKQGNLKEEGNLSI